MNKEPFSIIQAKGILYLRTTAFLPSALDYIGMSMGILIIRSSEREILNYSLLSGWRHSAVFQDVSHTLECSDQ